jgi:hypothetical protein
VGSTLSLVALAPRRARWALLSIVLYVVSFPVVMNPRVPAIDRYYHIAFDSSIRVGAREGTNLGSTVVFTRVTFFNYFYYPAELLYRLCWPARKTGPYYDTFSRAE